MASQVLQPLDEFRAELRNRLDAEFRSDLLHTGAVQDTERYRDLVYTRWWQYLRHRFDTTYKSSIEKWPVPELICSIQRAAGIHPDPADLAEPVPAQSESDRPGSVRYWPLQLRRRRWFIREHASEGFQLLWICWPDRGGETPYARGLTLTDRALDMVLLLDDKADAFDKLIDERKLEAWRRFTIHKIRQVTKSYGK